MKIFKETFLLLGFIATLVVLASGYKPSGECKSPKIVKTNCYGSKGLDGRNCDVCFTISYSDIADSMCMKAVQGAPCIFMGELESDNTFVAVTASNAGGNCEPFPSDFEVSLSTSGSCSGSFLVSNGVAKRPGCVFCNGSHDEVLYPPPYGSPSSCPDDDPKIIRLKKESDKLDKELKIYGGKYQHMKYKLKKCKGPKEIEPEYQLGPNCDGKCSYRSYGPICGTDGKTYSNKCDMKIEACKTNQDLGRWYNGKCGECVHCNDGRKDPKRCLSKCCPARCRRAKDPEGCIQKCRNDPY